MTTIGELRIACRELLYRLVRQDKIQLNDIRYIKHDTGTMPRKLTNYVGDDGLTKLKETPYLVTDEFIVFDVLISKNIAGELINNNYVSHMPFTLVVNIYGDEVQDELQYMLAKMSSFIVRDWLRKKKISLKSEPTSWDELDGKENGTWWKRRRFVLEMNTQQSIEYSQDDFPLMDEIDFTLEVLEGGK